MKTRILQILRNAQGYVSGQELCEELGVSRTAVWKSINKLKEEGYGIEAVQNKGYCILSCPDVVTKSEIVSRLSTRWAGRTVYYYGSTDSTNNQAKREAENGAAHGSLVVAETQSAGKGRRGRSWSSPAGTGIFMSLILKPAMRPEYVSTLTLVAALATAKAIEKEGISPLIKWPNDLVVNGKKVTGILTEMSTELEQIHYIVVGVGINVNMDALPAEISETATSLRIESGRSLSRAGLIVAFLQYFEEDFEKFEKTGDMSLLLEDYNKRLVNRDHTVKILNPSDPEKEYTGTALGINERGALLVERNGRTEMVLSGEVSVRGVYGYV